MVTMESPLDSVAARYQFADPAGFSSMNKAPSIAAFKSLIATSLQRRCAVTTLSVRTPPPSTGIIV